MTFKVTTLLLSGNGVDNGRSQRTLKIKKGDITQWFVDGFSDAIVNSANKGIPGGGGGNGGPRDQNSEKHVIKFQKSALESVVQQEKQELPHRGFKLPASHVIHTVGPIYDVDSNPEASLRSAYTYPCGETAKIAISTVKEFANDFKECLVEDSKGIAQSIVCVRHLD